VRAAHSRDLLRHLRWKLDTLSLVITDITEEIRLQRPKDPAPTPCPQT
jgi:hypothetical protein